MLQTKKTSQCLGVILLTENLRAQNVGKLVFSAVLWYNGTNEKASPFGRGGGEADGEGKMEREPLKKNNELLNVARILRRKSPSHPLSRELARRESLWMRSTLGVWALPL